MIVSTICTSPPIAVDALDRDFTRADIQFLGLDHSGASFEGRVFLNNPARTAAPARRQPTGTRAPSTSSGTAGASATRATARCGHGGPTTRGPRTT
jgi:hypothetical protein